MIVLKTGKRIEELSLKYWNSLFLFLAIVFFPENVFSGKVWDTEVVENFEFEKYNSDDLKVRLKNVKLPDVMISSTLTSPIIESDKSLLIRITDYINTPVELILKKQFKSSKYVGSFIFHV